MANRFLNAIDDGPAYCPGCNQVVLPKDRPVAALKATWHPGCLKCTVCTTTLNVRSLESYQNKPYCRAHRPSPGATAVADRVDVKQALAAPKAVKKEQGVDKTQRMTFAPGKLAAPPVAPRHAFVPPVSAPNTNARRVQGVNKTERMTFAPNAVQPPSMSSLSLNDNQSSYQDNSSSYDYNQSSSDNQSYDNQSYDNQESYDQNQGSYDQGGYDQQQSYDDQNQGSYDQSYDQNQGGYDQSYDQNQEGYDQSYDQQGYDQNQGYDQSYDQNQEGYDQSYDQQGYDQSYDQQGYDENQQYDDNQQWQ